MSHPSDPLRLLFIGNSYTQRNDLPGLISRLAAAGDPPREVVTAQVVAGGASLRRHWNAGIALETLRGAAWDGVVLQEQSTLPQKNPARYHENARLFVEPIRERGARILLYLTWARRDAPETQAALTDAVTTLAAEIDARVVPAGTAWEQVRRSGAGPELFDADGSHPTPAGTYLAACVFYAVLFGRSPEGLPVPEGFPLDPAHAAPIQQAAGAAAQEPALFPES